MAIVCEQEKSQVGGNNGSDPSMQVSSASNVAQKKKRKRTVLKGTLGHRIFFSSKPHSSPFPTGSMAVFERGPAAGVEKGQSVCKIFPSKSNLHCLTQPRGRVCSPSGMGISRHSISTAETPLAPRLIHQTGPSSEVQEKPLRLLDPTHPPKREAKKAKT